MIEGLKFEPETTACQRPLVSLVVPVLDERDAVGPFVAAVDAALVAGWPDRGFRG